MREKIGFVLFRSGSDNIETLLVKEEGKYTFPIFQIKSNDLNASISKLSASIGICPTLVSLDSIGKTQNGSNNTKLEIPYYAVYFDTNRQIEPDWNYIGYGWKHRNFVLRSVTESLDEIYKNAWNWLSVGEGGVEFLARNLSKMR